MRCDYVTVQSGQQFHYREAGSGPVLIMLHPSPQNSEALIPALQVFSTVCRCIAFDLPGYGLSDDLPIETPDITDYASAILDAVGALGIDKFFIYGAATGAIVTIQIAKQFPGRIHMAMVDSYGHMTDARREEVLDGYMPDATARRDGGHLFTYWDMCKHLFDMFPWHSGKAADRMAADVPPVAAIHDVFLRYLQAGAGYSRAYLPAMHKENRAHFDGLTVPTTLMRWSDSVVLNLTDAMIARDLPDCVTVLEAGQGFEARMGVQRDALAVFINEHALLGQAETDSAVFRPSGTLQRCYFAAAGLRIHGAVSRSGSGKPLIFLHGAGASHRQMMDYVKPYLGIRPIVIPDLPGHGHSVVSSEIDLSSLSLYVTLLEGLITEYDEGSIEIFGVGLGGAIALKLGSKAAISKVTLIDPVTLSLEEQQMHAERGLPDFTPEYDGTHLARAWSMVKDKALFWPWFDYRASAKMTVDADLSPERLHALTEDVLRLGAQWRNVAKLEIQLDWEGLIASARGVCEVEVSVTDQHPCHERADELTKHLKS